MGRVKQVIGEVAFAASLVVSVASGACMSAALTAPRARVPILIGPVGCIGCAPAPVPEQEIVVDNANRWSMVIGNWGNARAGKAPQLDAKAELAVPDPCRGQVRLSKVRASSVGSIAHFSVSVQVE